MHTLQQNLLDTPWWVYVIFIYVIYRGVRASQTRVISLARLFILPLIIVVFAGHGLLSMTTLTMTLIINWLITFIVGFVIGWWLMKIRGIKVDHKKGLLEVQGSWISLIVIFCSKYYVGYMSAVHPEVVQYFLFVNFIFALNGITMGIVVGHLAHYVYCFKTQPSISLESR